MKFWTESEYDKFIEEVKDKPLSFDAFEILYWCGLRTGELLALTKEKFDFTNNTIRVNQSLQRISGKNVITEPKTQKSIRTVVMPDFLAEEMKKLKRLVGWRKEKLNGKVAKLPFSLIDEKANGWNMPERWINFNDDRTKNRPLGFVLVEEDKIVCIDLDHAIQDGKLSLLAKEIIENFAGTYMELSQSAKGIHIFVQGTIPNNLNLSSQGIEIYKKNRHIALTGNIGDGSYFPRSKKLLEKEDELKKLYKKWTQEKPSTLKQIREYRHEPLNKLSS